jgi:CYTH domain-containing protein
MARENDTRTIPAWLGEELVDNEQSYRWLKFGEIKGENEGTIVAA